MENCSSSDPSPSGDRLVSGAMKESSFVSPPAAFFSPSLPESDETTNPDSAAQQQDGKEQELQEEEHEENLLPDEISFLSHHSVLPAASLAVAGPSVSQAAATQSPSSQDDSPGMQVEQAEEEDNTDAVGPDGYGGYRQVVDLAKALVELRHNAFITHQQATEIISLWNKLSDRDKRPLKYAPCHRDRQGHLKVTQRRSHIPSLDTIRRAFLGQGAGAARSPKASRLVEAILLQLCYLHHTDTRTPAGARINRWAVILRDYGIIQNNVYNNPHLMAHTRLQLFNVNQRTLSLWFNQREKERRAQCASFAVLPLTASMTAAEPLPPARSLLEETRTHSCLFKPNLPAALSGLAVTPRGPLAKDVYRRLSSSSAASGPGAARPAALSTTTAAPVSSTTPATSAPNSSTTPATSAPVSSTTPATSAPVSSTTPATSAPVSSTTPATSAPVSSTTPATSAPVSSTTPATSAPVSSTTPATSAPVSSTTPATSAPVSSTTPATSALVSSARPAGHTTAWRMKLHAEKVQRAQEAGLTVSPYRRQSQYSCRQCGQHKNKEFGHSFYREYGWFCAKAEGRPVEEWLAEKKKKKAAAAAAASSIQTHTQAAAANSIFFLVFPVSLPTPPLV